MIKFERDVLLFFSLRKHIDCLDMEYNKTATEERIYTMMSHAQV